MGETSSFTDRLDARLRDFDLTLRPGELEALDRYYQLLSHWNRRINLTALPLANSPLEALDRLLVEPILAGRLIEDRPMKWFDLGSGGGSPAIPLKIVLHTPRLTMVESVAKKAAFLRDAVQILGIQPVVVLSSRIEDLPQTEPRESVDVVTVRAVRLDDRVLKAITQLLKPFGRFLHFGSNASLGLKGFTVLETHLLTKTANALTIYQKI